MRCRHWLFRRCRIVLAALRRPGNLRCCICWRPPPDRAAWRAVRPSTSLPSTSN
jgi:hypothetical protein